MNSKVFFNNLINYAQLSLLFEQSWFWEYFERPNWQTKKMKYVQNGSNSKVFQWWSRRPDAKNCTSDAVNSPRIATNKAFI